MNFGGDIHMRAMASISFIHSMVFLWFIFFIAWVSNLWILIPELYFIVRICCSSVPLFFLLGIKVLLFREGILKKKNCYQYFCVLCTWWRTLWWGLLGIRPLGRPYLASLLVPRVRPGSPHYRPGPAALVLPLQPLALVWILMIHHCSSVFPAAVQSETLIGSSSTSSCLKTAVYGIL